MRNASSTNGVVILENYESIADVHVEQLDEPVKEQLVGKLAVVESYLSEPSQWETLEKKQKYDEALYNIYQRIGQDIAPDVGDG